MKKIITSLCLAFMLVASAFTSSKADTYYVLDGQEFNLIPQVGTAIFSQILWTIDGVAEPALTDNIGKLTKTFTLATGAKLTPVEHVLKLGVIADALGCVSDLVTHTVVVLPKVTLSISSPADSFCEGAVTGNLTVNVDVDIPALSQKYNVALTTFGWTGAATGSGPTIAIGANGGTYTVGADYIILTGTNIIAGALIPTATKIIGTGAVASATKVITTVAKPLVPALTFN